MTSPSTDVSVRSRPLRLWPGVAAVALQWFLWFVLPKLAPDALLYSIFGGLGCAGLVILWWLFFSRAPWLERLGALVLTAAVAVATRAFLHPSIRTGMMGMMYPIYLTPVLCLAFVAWAVVSRRWSRQGRWVALLVALVVACGCWTLVRTGGMTGSADSDFAWRWTPTPEDRLLAQAEPLPAPPPREVAAVPEPPAPSVLPSETPRVPAAPQSPAPEPKAVAAPITLPVAEPESEPVTEPVAAPVPVSVASTWPGFRGPHRDGILTGSRIDTDWKTSPPVELWRRPVGPGWSSFAVRGDFVFTQEQRGEEEVVSCYRLTTGEPVWRHADPTRFWESNGGAGPRGTPTLQGDRVYTLGATGLVNALRIEDGTVVWSRNAAADTGAKLPEWGFSASPLVVGDRVIVAAAGTLAAYDLATGALQWTGPVGGASYSSPQLLTIDGVAQVLFLDAGGLTSIEPSSGTVLWQYPWKGYPIVQPALTADGDVLISVSSDSGLRRLALSHGPEGWSVSERWTSIQLKPYFNDFVIHQGHAYGFDGRLLACIDVATGERCWKGGRYGSGQLELLADQDVLLVVSEQGELALVQAKPDGFTELGRVPGITGKTWNHPVLTGDVLLVRNDQEMAAFRLASMKP